MWSKVWEFLMCEFLISLVGQKFLPMLKAVKRTLLKQEIEIIPENKSKVSSLSIRFSFPADKKKTQ